jgi:Fe-S cluster assembly protein SufD
MPAATLDKETRLEDRFVAAFERSDGVSFNGTNAGLRRLRQDAIGHFAALGFPARKAEAWKYTNIGKILKRPYALPLGSPEAAVSPSDVAPLLIPGLDAHVAVFVNGHFNAALSSLGALPEGVMVTSLAHAAEAHADLVDAHLARYAPYEGEAFTALNTAFTKDGVFVYVPRHTVIEQPVHVITLVTTTEDALVQPRHLVVVEENAQARLLHSHRTLTPTKTLINAVTEVYAGAHAHVDRYELQDETPDASLITTLGVYQETGSVFRNSTFTLGGEVIRNNIYVLPNAEECETHLYGLFLGDGTMHVDNHTLVDHAMPNCFSNELYKGVLDDKAVGVFNGKVLVREDAQQINAYQSNKSIVLSDTASMYAKPELEIYADDVKCSHGATTGQLDDEALFYLRSRGLSLRRARALLLVAFARDVLDNVALEPLREALDAMVTARFSD